MFSGEGVCVYDSICSQVCVCVCAPQVRSSGVRVGSRKRRVCERRVTRMVCVVVLVFVLCWLPFYAFNVAAVWGSPSARLKGAFELVVLLAYANSCANPLLYAFLSHNFSKSFRNILCLRCSGGLGLDDTERCDVRHELDRTRAVNNVSVETHGTLLNSHLQTSI